MSDEFTPMELRALRKLAQAQIAKDDLDREFEQALRPWRYKIELDGGCSRISVPSHTFWLGVKATGAKVECDAGTEQFTLHTPHGAKVLVNNG